MIVDDNDNPTDDLSLHEIALDGLATGRLEKQSVIEIAPGQRSDLLIKAPPLPPQVPQRVYHIKQTVVEGINAPHGAAQDPLFLAKIVVTGQPRPMRLPDPKEVARCRPLPDIRGAELSGHKTFRFSGTDENPPFYLINDLTFIKQEPVPLVLNTAEEWTLKAEKLSHPFHIHVNPFQIVRYTDPNNITTHMNSWRDTLYIKEGETYVIRSRFLDFPGLAVFHCHILDHEDQGMMMPLKFYNPGQPPPAQEICTELHPPSTKLQAAATPAPALRLPDATGVAHDLSAHRGRTVALVFFQGAECARLRVSASRLGQRAARINRPRCRDCGREQSQARRSGSRLEGVGVVDSDRFHLLVDEAHKSFRDFGCFATNPQHGLFLIDGAGVIRSKYVGETPFDDTAQVINQIRQLAAPGRQTRGDGASIGRRGGSGRFLPAAPPLELCSSAAYVAAGSYKVKAGRPFNAALLTYTRGKPPLCPPTGVRTILINNPSGNQGPEQVGRGDLSGR